MTTIYEGMTIEQLDQEISDLSAAKKAAMLGGDVEEVRGENRALKYTRANMGDLNRELNAAMRERQRRGGDYEGGNALVVEF